MLRGRRARDGTTPPDGSFLAVWPQPPPPKDSAPLQRHFVPFLRRGLLGPSPTVGRSRLVGATLVVARRRRGPHSRATRPSGAGRDNAARRLVPRRLAPAPTAQGLRASATPLRAVSEARPPWPVPYGRVAEAVGATLVVARRRCRSHSHASRSASEGRVNAPYGSLSWVWAIRSSVTRRSSSSTALDSGNPARLRVSWGSALRSNRR